MVIPEPTAQNLTGAQVLTALGIIGFFLLWGGTFWRFLKVQAGKESAAKEALAKVATDLDRVGERVNNTNKYCSAHDEAITTLRLEQQASRDDRNSMRENIAANKASVRALSEELQQERLAVMSTLHANEKSAAERDAKTREELARISERLDIERMVSSVVRALNNNNTK